MHPAHRFQRVQQFGLAVLTNEQLNGVVSTTDPPEPVGKLSDQVIAEEHGRSLNEPSFRHFPVRKSGPPVGLRPPLAIVVGVRRVVFRHHFDVMKGQYVVGMLLQEIYLPL